MIDGKVFRIAKATSPVRIPPLPREKSDRPTQHTTINTGNTTLNQIIAQAQVDLDLLRLQPAGPGRRSGRAFRIQCGNPEIYRCFWQGYANHRLASGTLQHGVYGRGALADRKTSGRSVQRLEGRRAGTNSSRAPAQSQSGGRRVQSRGLLRRRRLHAVLARDAGHGL